MKNIILILFMMTILFSCVEETVEPVIIQYGDTYTISGKVTDQDGNNLPEASVTLWGNYRPSDGGIDSTANYFFSGLPSSSYIIGGDYKDIVPTVVLDTIFMLTSDTTLNLQLILIEEKVYSGTVYDMFNKSVADLEVKLNYNFDGNDKEIITKTNDTGFFEFRENMFWETVWDISVETDDYRLFSDNNSGDGFLSSTNEIRFSEKHPIIYDWKANEFGVSEFYKNSGIVRAEILVEPNSFTLNIINAENLLFTPFNKSPYTSIMTEGGEIHSIKVTDPNQPEFSGIFSVDNYKNPTTLKFEFGSADGPTIAGGFGSSNNGTMGDQHIWEFIRK